MHTVSLFPSFFDYSFLAIFMLRATLGFIFVWFAYTKIFHERSLRIAFFEKLGLRPSVFFFTLVTTLEGIAGILLVVGLFTQVAVLVTGALMILATYIKWHRPNALPFNTIEFYILLTIASFALLFLGPGALAFDLPL